MYLPKCPPDTSAEADRGEREDQDRPPDVVGAQIRRVLSVYGSLMSVTLLPGVRF